MSAPSVVISANYSFPFRRQRQPTNTHERVNVSTVHVPSSSDCPTKSKSEKHFWIVSNFVWNFPARSGPAGGGSFEWVCFSKTKQQNLFHPYCAANSWPCACDIGKRNRDGKWKWMEHYENHKFTIFATSWTCLTHNHSTFFSPFPVVCEKRRYVCAWEGNQQFNFIFKGKEEEKTHNKIKENSIMSKIKQTNWKENNWVVQKLVWRANISRDH